MNLEEIDALVAERERKNCSWVTLATTDARELVNGCRKAGESGHSVNYSYMSAIAGAIAEDA